MSFVIEGGARKFIPDDTRFQGLKEAAMVLSVDRVTVQGPHTVRAVTDQYKELHGVIRRRIDRTGYRERIYPREVTAPVTRSMSTRGYVEIHPNGSTHPVGSLSRPYYVESYPPRIADLLPEPTIQNLQKLAASGG